MNSLCSINTHGFHLVKVVASSPYASASISANSGATKTTNGVYTVFTYTSSGTFTVATGGYVSVLIVGMISHIWKCTIFTI